jgi:integrase
MRDVSGNAANRDRKNLKAAWQYGLDFIDEFPQDMAEPFPRRKMAETRNDRYIPPEEDFWKVVEVATGQDRVMLLTYFALAARRSEVYRLQLKDLDFKRNMVRLYTRKRENGTEEFDWLPMKGSLRKELKAHVERKNISDPEAYVFANDLEHSRYKGSRYGKRKHWMKTLCMKAGVPYFTLHAIRHITPSILDDQGESLKTIQKIMRHKSPATTLKYLHQMRPERDALERLEIKVPT